MIQAFTLLAMALQLLIAVNQPHVPQSLKNTAISVANTAIEIANKAISEQNLNTISPTPSLISPPTPSTIPTNTATNPVMPLLSSIATFPIVPTATLLTDEYHTPEGISIIDDGLITFSWASTNADSCMGYGEDYASGYVSRGIRDPKKWGWHGIKSTSGKQIITAQESGDFRFWIECTNSVSSGQSDHLMVRVRSL